MKDIIAIHDHRQFIEYVASRIAIDAQQYHILHGKPPDGDWFSNFAGDCCAVWNLFNDEEMVSVHYFNIRLNQILQGLYEQANGKEPSYLM